MHCMLKINLFDESFRHTFSSSYFSKPTFFEFVRDQYDWDGITMFTDDWIIKNEVNLVKSKIKIAWLLEPRIIKPYVYNLVDDWQHIYDYIITHDKEILDKYPDKSFYCPVGACWIDREDQNIYIKRKLLSIVVSSKQETLGQKLRHKIVDIYKDKIDVFGRAYNPIEKKEESLKDYAFQIVVENCSVDGYFSEKIIDCFATGTVPIYWGCKNIGDYFDVNGIIIFNNLSELSNIIEYLNFFGWDKKFRYIMNNFQLFKDYEITEDWMWINILEKMWKEK